MRWRFAFGTNKEGSLFSQIFFTLLEIAKPYHPWEKGTAQAVVDAPDVRRTQREGRAADNFSPIST